MIATIQMNFENLATKSPDCLVAQMLGVLARMVSTKTATTTATKAWVAPLPRMATTPSADVTQSHNDTMESAKSMTMRFLRRRPVG